MKVHHITHLLALCVSVSGFGINAPKAFTSRTSAALSAASLPGDAGTETKAKTPAIPSGVDSWDATWAALTPERIQGGGALRTWDFPDPAVKRVYVSMTTEGPPEGNPLKAHIVIRKGPNNPKQSIDVISGKARLRPFRFILDTPDGMATLFMNNDSPLEFPIAAGVGSETNDASSGLMAMSEELYEMTPEQTLQGGAVRSWQLPDSVKFVKVTLRSTSRPLNGKIELVQTPNATKYIIDVYTEDGVRRPFCFILETPGVGNTIRVVNTAPTMEFPLIASVGPQMS